MKKKIILTGVLVLAAAALGIWFLTRPKVLGNMNHAYTEPETSVSVISFSGESGDRIKLSFASNAENGDLDIIVCDSKGNVVKELDKAKEMTAYLTLEYSDIYELQARHKEFTGSYAITIYQSAQA